MLKLLVEEFVDERGEKVVREILLPLAVAETKAVWENSKGGDMWQETLLNVKLAFLKEKW